MRRLIFRVLITYATVILILPQNSYSQVDVTLEFSKTVIPAGDTRELAVAFYSITYIDSVGHSIGELDIGTPESNAVQGEGWFENESSADVGAFQWAGGPLMTATIQLTIPANAEGILLSVKSIEDSMWMDVTVDGQLEATLRVDSYWHSGYVPLGSPVPEPQVGTEPVWTQGEYFPNFSPTDRVYAIRVKAPLSPLGRAWGEGWRVNQSFDAMMSLTLVSMQGLINRTGPRLYIHWWDSTLFTPDPTSGFWMSELEKYVEVVYLDLDPLSAVNFLMRRFASQFLGLVIYDPKTPDSINLATMLAGLENRIMIAPEQIRLPGIPDLASVNDLRTLVTLNGWDDSEASQYEIYKWAYDNLWQDLDHRMIGIISPGPPTSRELNPGSGPPYWPLGMASRDYLIALKLPAIYLHPIDNPQLSLFESFLGTAESPIPILGGFAGYEEAVVKLVAGYGDWQAVISWPGEVLTVGNLTVLNGLEREAIPYQSAINPDKIIATLSDKPVATMISTDGDAMFYLMARGFQGQFGWQHVQNQPFGWSINPTLFDLAPMVWNYYMESRSEVSLLCAIQGAGYTHTFLMDETQIQNYLIQTALYLNKSGLRSIHIIENQDYTSWTEDLATAYYTELKDSGYLGVIFGYAPTNYGRGLGFHYSGAPTPAAYTSYRLNSTTTEEIVNNILTRVPGEEFIHIATANPSVIQTSDVFVVDDVDARLNMALLIPSDFINSPSYSMAINSGKMSLAPGNYQFSFRMKVSDNTSTGTIAYVNMARFSNNHQDFVPIATKLVSPSEFPQVNEYADFSFSFTLDTLTNNFEIWLDYGDGATDLYVDYFYFEREGGLALPVFNAVVINNIDWSDSELRYAPGRFREQFEGSGGIVLNSDEFLATLNPEFMIEFSKPYVGATDREIILAEAQLSAGDYFNSLITVRDALRNSLPTGVSRPGDWIDPIGYVLEQNYPNPFNPSTVINYFLPEAERALIVIYNVQGEEVARFINDEMTPGNHTITWYSSNMASGVYLYRLQAGDFVQTRKMVLLR